MEEYNKYLKVIGNINTIASELNDITESLQRKETIHNLDVAFLNSLLEESTHNFQTISNKLSYNSINVFK